MSAYRDQLFELETYHMGKWVGFHGGQRVGIFDSFQAAAEDAVKKFGRGPYLIRPIGAPPITLPVYVATRDDGNELRV